MGNELIIRMDEIRKVYDTGKVKVEALKGIDLEVHKGEMLAIVGPSGSGKSTLMNLLGCLDSPTSGEYRLAGETVSHLSADAVAAIRNRSIGFVFQNFNLLPRTTALENVALPLLYSRVRAGERRTRAMARLAEVGLADRAGHQPAQLSGGQQQRVAIARALVNEPLLILADEPTGALDTRTSFEVMGLLQGLNRRGITVVLVTHEHDIAGFATRVIGFRDGRVVSDEANARPADAGARLRDLERRSELVETR